MKTREILKVLIFFTGIGMLSVACNKKDDSPKLDFEITVPEGWAYYTLNVDNVVYYASSPMASQDDSVKEDILITRDAITNTTLDQFTSLVINSLDNDTSYHQLYLSGDTTINGETCRRLLHLESFAVPVSPTDTIILPLEKEKYIYVNNNYGYVVSMNALVPTFPTYKPIFDTIISSFKFNR